MRVNFRFLLAAIGGLACAVTAMRLEGGHPLQLLHGPSLLLVGITAFGGLLLLRGARSTGRVLAGAFVVPDRACADRAERLDALEVLERTTLLGGLLGLLVGTIHAVWRVDEPQRVGPALYLGFASLIVAVAVQAFFVMPQKHQLLRAEDEALRLPIRRAFAWTCGIGGGCLIAATGLAFAGEFAMGPDTVHALLLLGVVAPSALVASDSPLRGPWSSQRLLWYSDAFAAAGVLGVGLGLVHLFSVLDQPKLLTPGIAFAVAGLLWPLVGSVLLRLQRPTPGTSPDERPGARNLQPVFAGCALLGMAGLTVLVLQSIRNTA